MLHAHDRRLDLRVVVWVVGGEERDALSVHRPEPGRSVRDLLADDGRNHQREQPDPEPARERRLVAAAAREARPDAQVGLAGYDRRENRRQLRRVVLSVAVDLDRDVVAVLECEAIARLHRAADTEVEGEAKHVGTAIGSDTRGAVRGAVVDHDDVEARIERAELVDHAADGLFLVQCRNDRDPPQLGDLLEHGVVRGRRHFHELSHRRPPVTAGP